MTSSTLASELFQEISKITCINTHSHLGPEESRLTAAPDILELFGDAYPRADLVASGMSEVDVKAVTTPGLPLHQRWTIFEPYWRYIRLTGYSQAILEGIRDLLGFDELSAASVQGVDEALQQHCNPAFTARSSKSAPTSPCRSSI